MDVISYRGPSAMGGVATAISMLWKKLEDPQSNWWYFSNCQLMKQNHAADFFQPAANVSSGLVASHYKFCNDVIWPIMHSLPEFAGEASEQDYRAFVLFNRMLAWHVRDAAAYFVNDYQFSLLPSMLPGSVTTFWHIPWPELIPSRFKRVCSSLARGLVDSTTIGFHSHQYADNFLEYVQQELRDFEIDRRKLSVSNRNSGHTTRLVVAPLGIESKEWRTGEQDRSTSIQTRRRRTCVLSVDRADYTKGVIERLESIETFLRKNPHRVNEIIFVQLCQPTRVGLAAFDKYWLDCRSLAEEINARWATEDWSPIVWDENFYSQVQLAQIYRNADVIFNTSLADGLNLTIKEFIAAQTDLNKSVVVSQYAGVAHELGHLCAIVNPRDRRQTADQLERSLREDEFTRAARMRSLKRKLESNGVRSWLGKLLEEQFTVSTAGSL